MDIRNAANGANEMTTKERRNEAQRVADANDGEIIYIDDDADFFQIRHTIRATENGITGDYSVITNFEWNEFRYEGF